MNELARLHKHFLQFKTAATSRLYKKPKVHFILEPFTIMYTGVFGFFGPWLFWCDVV